MPAARPKSNFPKSSESCQTHPEPPLSEGIAAVPERQAVIPTADDIAYIVIAACRETGENPLAIADMKPMRARYYAHQAIIDVFGHPANPTSRLVGYRSKGTSLTQAVKHARAPGRGQPHRAHWWSSPAFQRVASVAEQRRALRQLEPTQPVPQPAPAPAPGPTESPRTLARATRDPESLPAAEPPPRPAPSASTFTMPTLKRRGYDLLAEAVRNTAAKTPPPED